MQQSNNKNNWLQIVTERLDRSSGAGTVEVSIRYEDITIQRLQVEPLGSGAIFWTEDWLGHNIGDTKKADIVHLARSTVLAIAMRSGWLLVKDGVDFLTFEDGKKKCNRFPEPERLYPAS